MAFTPQFPVALRLNHSVIIGFGCGLATVLVPLYLSEIAPPSMKKSLGIANQFFIVVGILIGQSLSIPFSQPLRWRWVLLVAVGIAALQLGGSFLVGEGRKTDEVEPRSGGEGRPLLPQAQEEATQEPLSISGLLASSDPAVKRGCECMI